MGQYSMQLLHDLSDKSYLARIVWDNFTTAGSLQYIHGSLRGFACCSRETGWAGDLLESLFPQNWQRESDP